jgi:hypothetical protein
MKYDIFISYSRTNRELVASVVRRLEARGVGVWYDAEIDGGADWRETIVEALTHSDMLAIFFSEQCNNSRQLKKELAVADNLGKPVVPILIENTQPRGAYLYELADRNWIQAWPDPMDRVDERVEHLATLAGKSDGGLQGAAAPKKKTATPPDAASMPAAANDGIPAPAANDDVEEQPLAEAVGEFIEQANTPSREAPKIATAYVGSASRPGKKKLNDILPFKWIDLVVLLPALIGFLALAFTDTSIDRFGPATILGMTGIYLLFVAAYGTVVFPVRYFLRRRPVWKALSAYTVSSLVLVGAFVALVLASFSGNPTLFGVTETGEPLLAVDVILAGGVGYLLIFTVIAFAIYGLLSGQRAIRSFRSNIRKL